MKTIDGIMSHTIGYMRHI